MQAAQEQCTRLIASTTIHPLECFVTSLWVDIRGAQIDRSDVGDRRPKATSASMVAPPVDNFSAVRQVRIGAAIQAGMTLSSTGDDVVLSGQARSDKFAPNALSDWYSAAISQTVVTLGTHGRWALR